MNKLAKREDIKIRPAIPNDIPTILNFIRELASFEKLTHQVEATEQQLRQTLFSKKPIAKVLIAEIKKQPVGFLLYFYNYSTFLGRPGIYIEDLYVKPLYRKQGVGKALVKCCCQIGQKLGVKRIEWAVLNWNPARQFYEKLGAKPLKEWILYRLEKGELKASEENKK